MYESELSVSLRADQKTVVFVPGSRVRVTQQIARRTDTYAITVEGIVLRHERQGSGSWFARNKHNKVWLDRLVIKKDDGEITILNLDEYTSVEILAGHAPVVGETKMVLPNEDAASGVT